MEFNEKFLALRDVKRSLCDALQQKLVQVKELNKKLGVQEEIVMPQLLPGEEPERRDHVTDEEIAAYIAEKEAAAEDAAAGAGAGALGGFGGAGARSQTKPAPDVKDKAKSSDANKESEPIEDVLARIAASYPMPPREQAQKALNERRWVRTNQPVAPQVDCSSTQRQNRMDPGCRTWKRICCTEGSSR